MNKPPCGVSCVYFSYWTRY